VDKFIKKQTDNITYLIGMLTRPGGLKDRMEDNYLSEENLAQKRHFLERWFAVKQKIQGDEKILRDALGSGIPELRFEAARGLRREGTQYLGEIYSKADESLKIKMLEYVSRKWFGKDFLLPCSSADYKTEIGLRELIRYYAVKEKSDAETDLEKIIVSNNPFVSDGIRKDAIRALAVCGTYRSIEFLNRNINPSFYREADKAIAMIQDRIGTGDSGWLSLRKTEDSEGALSIEKETGNDD
jgi:hypothetical protein